jgi:hypothetical protein
MINSLQSFTVTLFFAGIAVCVVGTLLFSTELILSLILLGVVRTAENIDIALRLTYLAGFLTVGILLAYPGRWFAVDQDWEKKYGGSDW